MKKSLFTLTTLSALFAGSLNAQFVQDPINGTPKTGMSFSGNKLKTTGVGEWVAFTPQNSNSSCNSGPTWGIGPFEKTTNIGFGLGAIRTGYDDFGGGCTESWPSFNFRSADTDIDLSSKSNHHLTIDIISNKNFQVYFQLFDKNFEAKLNTLGVLNIVGDSIYHSYMLNFDQLTLTLKDLSALRQFSFVYANSTPLTAIVGIRSMALGSAKPLGLENDEISLIKNRIFPNPSSGNVQLEYTLKSAGEVSIFLSDLSGKQVMPLEMAEHSSGVYNLNFDVTNLKKGLYMLNMQVNGSTTSIEKFIVE